MATVSEDDLIDSSGNGVFDKILHFSLLVGAIFQLVCIFAVIFLPPTSEEKENDASGKDSAKEVASERTQPRTEVQTSSHRKRIEKKKRK